MRGPRRLGVVLLLSGVVIAVGVSTLIVTGEVPSIATAAALGLVVVSFAGARATTPSTAAIEEPNAFDFLPALELSPDQIQARPGNILVPVRNPHAIA